jgi:hypothetical protein
MISSIPRVGITAVASSLPRREVTTADLQRRVAAGLPWAAHRALTDWISGRAGHG